MPDAIGIVGAGAVAQAIGRALYDRGEWLIGVASRTPAHASAAAHVISRGPVGSPRSDVASGVGVPAMPIAELAKSATHILIATADAGVMPAAEALAAGGFRGVALHTCGARGPDALAPLQRAGAACGVLHPLQTIVRPTEAPTEFRGVTFGVAGDAAAVAWGRALAERLGGQAVEITTDRLPVYHAAAVMASNAIVAVLESALELMTVAGFEPEAARQAIAPIARTAVANVVRLGPDEALTGPITRGDAETVQSHMRALQSAAPSIRELYRQIGLVLVEIARRRGLDRRTLDALASALEVGQAGGHHGAQAGSDL